MNLQYSLLISCLLVVEVAAADPIAEAYRAIPHAQTTYDASRSELSKEDAQQLSQLLHLSDRALVERVNALAWLQTNGARGQNETQYQKNIQSVIGAIEDMQVSSTLDAPRKKLIAAIRQQQAALGRAYATVASSGKAPNIIADTDVQRAHQGLIAMYNELMTLYSSESAHNKKAFFDHLCALDFI